MKGKVQLFAIVGVILVAFVTRLLPHYPNVTAVGAAALFAGAYFSKRLAFLIPVAVLFISNLFLNNLIYAKQFPELYDGFVWFTQGDIWVYAGFIAVSVIGILTLKKTTTPRVIGASFLGSLAFFLISNFGSWVASPVFEKSAAGLVACYTAAIPFFWNTVFGDLFYVTVLFGSFALYQAWQTRTQVESV